MDLSDSDRLNTQFPERGHMFLSSRYYIGLIDLQIHVMGMVFDCRANDNHDDDDDDDDDDVRQTETSWRRPTSAELTLTYLTLSASYKSQLAKTLYFRI